MSEGEDNGDFGTGLVAFLLALVLVLGFFFLFFHQGLYWVMSRALLSEDLEFDLQRTLVVAVLNGIVAVPLYHTLDKLILDKVKFKN